MSRLEPRHLLAHFLLHQRIPLVPRRGENNRIVDGDEYITAALPLQYLDALELFYPVSSYLYPRQSTFKGFIPAESEREELFGWASIAAVCSQPWRA